MKEARNKLKISEILGIPKKGIIFSDLDGVWLDENNNFSSPNSSDLSILEKAREAGYMLVLNSDTAAETLTLFSKELGFDPFVIGENGAVVYLPNQGIKEYLSSMKPFFDRFKPKVIQAIVKTNSQAALFVGNATPFLKQTNFFPPSQKTAYLINTTRECSIGVYTRTIQEDGTLKIDDQKTQYTEYLLNFLLESKKEKEELMCIRYPNLGSCLVKQPTLTKWKAVKWVIDQFPPGLSYYMIGDTIYDSVESLGQLATTCAVGNASAGLRESVLRSGGILAPQDLTIAQGANFIIKQILERG